MKAIKLMIAVAVLAACALPASAQFRIGPRIGTEVNSMSLDKTVFNNDNRAGFTGGVQVEFTVPLIGVGFDASLMYVHRVTNSTLVNNSSSTSDSFVGAESFKSRDYIEIPVNLKYKFGLPVIGKVFTPYIFTGPSFAFLTSKKAITAAYENKSVDVAWNAGIGIQLIEHLQISASRGFGLTKSIVKLAGIDGQKIDGKNNYWTITAAWLF